MQRRTLLGALAAASAGALSGCGMLPGGSGDGGTVDGQVGTIEQWATSGSVPPEDVEYFSGTAEFPARVRANSGDVPQRMLDSFTGAGPPGLDPADQSFDFRIAANASGPAEPSTYLVSGGSFRRSEIVGTLEAAGYERSDEHGRFQLLHDLERPRPVWIAARDDALVWKYRGVTGIGDSTIDTIDRVEQTAAGDRQGLLQRADPVRAGLERLAPADLLYYSRTDEYVTEGGEAAGFTGVDAVLEGNEWRTEDCTFTDLVVFEHADAAAAADPSVIQPQEQQGDGVERSATVDGRFLEVTRSGPFEAFLG